MDCIVFVFTWVSYCISLADTCSAFVKTASDPLLTNAVSARGQVQILCRSWGSERCNLCIAGEELNMKFLTDARDEWNGVVAQQMVVV